MSSVSVRQLDLNYGAVKVLKNLNIEVDEGEFLVLLGASGCGKSTLLNCIAGLCDVSAGQVFINDRNVTWEEPSKRGIGMVFQSYALYPQMSVEGNLAFGLKNAGMKRTEIAERIARAAAILQIDSLLKRKPAALSGGQRQRVAIGRALVRDVNVFLFDEPLSNLDAKLRADLRVEIKRLHQKLNNTMIYVTHDQIEAMTLADRIAIMKDGLIQQLGAPQEIYTRPANKYVADFVGSPAMNFLQGVLMPGDEPGFHANDLCVPLARYDFAGPVLSAASVWFGIRPEHVVTGPAASALAWHAELEVDLVEPMGSDTLVWTQLNGVDFHLRMDGQARVTRGDRLLAGFDPAQASMFDVSTERRL